MVKLRPLPSTFDPAFTVTEFWCIDAWITRTSASLRAMARLSPITCSFRPDSGPMPATV